MKYVVILTVTSLIFFVGCSRTSPVPPINDSSQASEPRNDIQIPFDPRGQSSSLHVSEGGITWTNSVINIHDSPILTIDQFPDSIQAAPKEERGDSERITGAALSPDKKWIAITIAGSAHDFGWLYSVATKILRPVAFSYGGGVDFKKWSDDSRYVTFAVTTPKPETTDIIIDLLNPPEYPRLP